MDSTDLNCSSNSTDSNASAPVSTGSFYGKKLTCPKVQVKVTKLSTSDLEYHLGKLPSKTSSEYESKFSRPRRKILPVIGSEATRHKIKPLSARKTKTKVNQNGKFELKVTKLSTSDLEYYLGKLPTKTASEYESKFLRPRRKILPVKGSEATRHKIKPLSARRTIKKVKQNGKELKGNSKEERSNVRKNPERASTRLPEKGYMDLNSDCSDDDEDYEVTSNVQKNPKKKQPAQTSEEDSSDEEKNEYINKRRKSPRKTKVKPKHAVSKERVRKAYGRKAATGAKDKIKKAYECSDSEEVTPQNIPKPEFSDYEKAAQEKLALHKEFLKSLKIHSL
ncbi:protein FAM133-like isoform X2 [Palaemon carinicauda]|uniref:protein FAM133-like isoform X2 n=1 Tax=Palaemon carinicauda TaxID=392227 RepID=UPI0035B60613